MKAHEVDPVVLKALAREPSDDLRQYRQAVPLPSQQRLIDQAVADARAVGLFLPARIGFHYIDSNTIEAPVARGQAIVDDSGFTIVLDLACAPRELRRVLFHELQHVSDLYTGRVRQLPRVEFELRAVNFVSRMMSEEKGNW
jgi:hypothetical protein